MTSLIKISTGEVCSITGRNLNPQESGDICFAFVFNHKSNSVCYFEKGGENSDSGYQFQENDS